MFNFRDLGADTRAFMLAEFEADVDGQTLYRSTRFTHVGNAAYPDLARTAFESGTEVTLARSLEKEGLILKEEARQERLVKVPANAAITFAEGEFNRFYVRAVCLRALGHGTNVVEIYRAKEVVTPRAESVEKVGSRLPATTLLDDLRSNPGLDLALGSPPGPNSGLSAFCPCETCCA